MVENLVTDKSSSDNRVQKLNSYFSYRTDTKQIQDLAFNYRGIIINERFWNRLRNELIELLQDQGPLVLYQLGVGYGVEVGSQAREVSEDVVSAIKFFEYYGLLAGWGRLETSEFEPIEGRLRVKIHDSFFARSAKSDNGQPSCYFVSGMLAGLLEGLTEEGYQCLEIKCLCSGSKFCEFVLKRNSSEQNLAHHRQ